MRNDSKLRFTRGTMKRMQAYKLLFRSYPQHRWVPFFILFISLFVTTVSSLYILKIALNEERSKFSSVVTQVQGNTADRMATYIDFLEAGSGLFAASDSVTADEFKIFIQKFQLIERYPGIRSIGYSQHFVAGEKDTVLEQLRGEIPEFTLNPDTIRDDYHAVTYLEPQDDRSRSVIGYDMYTNPDRQKAMEKARDTNLPVMTGLVDLYQQISTERRKGFLIYVPIYTSALGPQTVQERRDTLEGFIYGTFQGDRIFNDIFNFSSEPDVYTQIYLGNKKSSTTLLYETGKKSSIREIPFLHTLLYEERTITVGEQQWKLEFSKPIYLERTAQGKFLPYVIFSGCFAGFVLFLISRLQLTSRKAIEGISEDLLRSESALQDSNKQLTTMMESIIDGFLSFDKGWNFNYVNKQAARMFGRPSKDLLGKNVWEEFPELANTSFGKLFRKSFRVQKPLSLEDYYEPFNSWFYVRVYPSRNGISTYFLDVTERRKLENQKDDFLGIASHELKTPVTSLKAYAQILQRRFNTKGDQESATLLSKMNSQLDKLATLVSDLLDVTKIDGGRIQFNEELFSIDDLTEETVEEIQRTTDKHTIQITNSTKTHVWGDRYRISQVIVNLLTNAVKYSPEEGEILVHVANQNDKAVISITDSGIGIPKTDRKKIFTRFFRVASAANRFSGLGIGLYISYEIIRRHGGTMWVESEEGKGSTFFFTLPLKKKKINTKY